MNTLSWSLDTFFALDRPPSTSASSTFPQDNWFSAPIPKDLLPHRRSTMMSASLFNDETVQVRHPRSSGQKNSPSEASHAFAASETSALGSLEQGSNRINTFVTSRLLSVLHDTCPFEPSSAVLRAIVHLGRRDSYAQYNHPWQRFCLTGNLSSAIHYLTSHEDILLWVDAVRIDQSDKAGKGWQIEQMRSVCERANTVHVWLGLEDSNDAHAIDTLATLESARVKDMAIVSP